MASIELYGEKIRLQCEFSDIAAAMQMIDKEEEPDEPVQKVREEGNVPCRDEKLVQTSERLGEASTEEEKAVAAIEDLIDNLRENAKCFWDMPIPPEVRRNILKAARVLEIELQRREYRKLGDAFKDRDALRVLEADK